MSETFKTLHLTGGYDAVCAPPSQIKADLITDGGAIIKKGLCAESDITVHGNILTDLIQPLNNGPLTLNSDVIVTGNIIGGGIGGGGITIEDAIYANRSSPVFFSQLVFWDTTIKSTPAFSLPAGSGQFQITVNRAGLVNVSVNLYVNDVIDVFGRPYVAIIRQPGGVLAQYSFNASSQYLPNTATLSGSFKANVGDIIVVAGSLLDIPVRSGAGAANSNLINLSIIY